MRFGLSLPMQHPIRAFSLVALVFALCASSENLRIVQVFGPGALDVSPRIGHIHVTVDDAPWH